ncbi:MAG: DNA-binding response regulator [Bacteroidetes bacterium]|nr:MAG: DNA-binding response regulator [Bacteroidota bacterium]
MIKTILVDDEVHCLDTLSILLANYCPEVKILAKCQSGEDALDSIGKFRPDLVFLDIQMPGMNGFQLLENFVQVPFSVIFATGYDQYAIKAIRLNALDYLLKPIDARELLAAIHKIKSHSHLPSKEQFEAMNSQLKKLENCFSKIAIATLEGYEMVPVKEIIYCEADNNYTHFHIKNGKKKTACRTLKEVEEQLLIFSFFIRVHHSYLINLNEVDKYVRGEGGYLVMNGDSTVNVSRNRKELLLKKLTSGK